MDGLKAPPFRDPIDAINVSDQEEPDDMGNLIKGMITNSGVVGEVIQFLWARKLWWLIPMVIVLLVMGLLLIFASASGVAPFIYTLF